MSDFKKDRKNICQIARLITLPFTLAVPLMVGWFIGNALDKFFDTKPYLTYFLIALGLGSGGIEFYRIIKKQAKDE